MGEVRSAEAIDMLQALNTGHDGSLSTGHANSPKDMLSRLETMVLMGMDLPLPAIQRQIASGLDIIVHLGRLRDKTRKVLEVTEVLGYWEEEIHLQTLYCFEEAYKEAVNVTEDEEKREIRMERKSQRRLEKNCRTLSPREAYGSRISHLKNVGQPGERLPYSLGLRHGFITGRYGLCRH